ncbi:tetratricopeptide repeat protein [Virgibacillus sp. W0430]|uniref:tetratricopeptide repeat protein n=1 Tax=Virgibacillus sp. W0430 TaxID=3391580 RepID=UPI003F4895D1
MQKRSNKAYKNENIITFIPEGDFYFSKGVEAFQKGKFDVAIKWLKKAIYKAPNDPVYESQLAAIYTEMGQFDQSNRLLEKLVQVYGEKYIDCHYLLANNYAHLGLFQTAKKHAHMYLDHENEGEFKEELESLLHLIDEEELLETEIDEDFLMYRESVLDYMEQSEWENALPLLREMRMLYPEDQLTKHQFTTALFFSGNEREAINEEWNYLKEDPSILMSYLNLSIFYYELNEKQSFENMINVIQNVYPIHEEKKLQLAITLARTNHYDQAYVRFKMIKDPIVKNEYRYYKWFSLTAYRIGKIDIANSIIEKGSTYYSYLKREKECW